jgi:hypothetical protein
MAKNESGWPYWTLVLGAEQPRAAKFSLRHTQLTTAGESLRVSGGLVGAGSGDCRSA